MENQDNILCYMWGVCLFVFLPEYPLIQSLPAKLRSLLVLLAVASRICSLRGSYYNGDLAETCIFFKDKSSNLTFSEVLSHSLCLHRKLKNVRTFTDHCFD